MKLLSLLLTELIQTGENARAETTESVDVTNDSDCEGAYTCI